MDRKPVEGSSSVKSRGYDADEQRMEVEFHSGTVYEYNEVPQEKWNEWLAADSVGSFFSREFRFWKDKGVVT